MSAAIPDDELSISISTTNTRRLANPPLTSRHHNSKRDERDPHRSHGTRPELVQRPSSRLDQYHIIKTLGEGSFGKVKLATHIVSGQKVALKIISRKKLLTRDMAGRIEREIQYLQLLRHPHIIKLFTVITTDREIIMVLEYAGGELFDYIVQHGRMTEDKARRFFQQIICAIEYCHRHKIVHRDLKPENLLLDEHLSVKIADFGLSNIMTDGNFLKTSCGSPNYAAPEVISGKLYAGPEVDVWSCGVILYVLLCGRLPFDDEYIPALFRKIQQGNFTTPQYLSPGAVRLIRKMLQVNAVSRITIGEIRQDPWFNKDLAPYLQVPAEEFYNTGVDPNKAIDPKTLAAKSQPAPVIQKLHDNVVDTLQKKMGYPRDDVTEALSKEEPNAIKDAYLIVRENQIMKQNPLLAQEASLQQYLAQSPPPSMTAGSPITRGSGSPQIVSPPQPMLALNKDRDRQGSNASAPAEMLRSPANTIAILPTSLPDFHKAYMAGHPQPDTNDGSLQLPDGPPQNEEQKAETARRLKPHSRSSINLANQAKPERMTPIPQKKPARTKWQFGIRSRNAPAEAMLAIYKALRAMGAEWETPRIRRPGRRGGDQEGQEEDDEDSDDSTGEGHPQGHWSDDEGDVDQHHSSRPISIRSSGRDDGRGRTRDGIDNDWGYQIAEDPWVINARYRKMGMFAPGINHLDSAQSSRVDLPGADEADDRSLRSAANGHSTSQGSQPSMPETSPSSQDMNPLRHPLRRRPEATEACYVYLTIQLYQIDADFFLVDFKCAGYEALARELITEIKRNPAVDVMSGSRPRSSSRFSQNQMDSGDPGDEHAPPTSSSSTAARTRDGSWRRLRDGEEAKEGEETREREVYDGMGRAQGEKLATSPYPFLDVASALIIQLAEGDQ